MKKTRELTFCAILSAIGFVALYLISLISVLDLTAVVIASVTVYLAREELGLKSIGVYTVISLLSCLLLPNLETGVKFVVIGLYPILKAKIDTLPSPLALIFRWVVIVLSVGVNVLLVSLIFTNEVARPWYLWAGISLLGVVAYFVYDIALNRLHRIYQVRIRKQLKIDRFFGK